MTYRIVSVLRIVSDLHGNAPIMNVLQAFKMCDFSYDCAAVDKISTDSASHGRCAIADLLVLCGGQARF